MNDTILIRKIVQKANFMLASSSNSEVEKRKGCIELLESILRDTGNYRGFHHLTVDELVYTGLTPGINTDYTNSHKILEDIELRYANTDDTRRKYNLK